MAIATAAIATLIIGALVLFVLNKRSTPFTDPPVAKISFFRALYYNLIDRKAFPERQNDIRAKLSAADKKIYEDWIGPIRVLSVTTPEAIRTQFDNKRFPKLGIANTRLIGFKSSFSYYLFGENVVGAVGEEYQLHRSVTRPAFSKPFRVPSFVSCVSKLVKILATHDKHHADIPVDVYPFMQRLTLDVLGAAMLSFNFKSLEAEDKITNASDLKPGRYVDIWNELMENALKPINILIPYYPKLPLESNKRAWKVAREFRGLMENIVDERIAQKRDGLLQEKKDTDLVDLMVEAVDDSVTEQKWTRKEIVDNIAVFFVAGHDTTANALAAAFYLLAANPIEQDKLRSEVTGIFGKPATMSDAVFENADLSNFSHQLAQCGYVNGVIKEAMRLYPSVPITGLRVATEDTPIRVPMPDGSVRTYTIKKGAVVRANIMDMQYDPDVFPDPTRFMPERWLKKGGSNFDDSGDTSASNTSGWMPFGGGLRMCMGIQMSLLEQRMVLAMLIRSFRVELSETTRKDGYVFGPANLLRPLGMKLFFRPLVC
ncbi:cytochrome P450 [Cladochytrium replicatum]|nr:cytochrome P450 [Cladochytrium replicatum]